MVSNDDCRESQLLPKLENAEKSDKASESSEPQTLRRISHKGNMAVEKVRLQTFQGWPNRHVNKEALAKAGMFFLHFRDVVQCFFCTVIIGYWEEGKCSTSIICLRKFSNSEV